MSRIPTRRVALGAPLKGHRDRVLSVAFSPDGQTLASGSADNTIILWDVAPESWNARICQMVGRNLTKAEWARYFGEQGGPYRKTCDQWPPEPEATPTPTLTPMP